MGSSKKVVEGWAYGSTAKNRGLKGDRQLKQLSATGENQDD
jgi:hypothetical protein